jgi:hypothetical protein
MSATTDIYVSPSTSLVLLKNLSSLTNVYLRDYNAPNFTVSIRDTTGLSSIRTTPVRISTIGSARFADGTSFYALNQPYGLVNLSLRNSTIWQINHTSGQVPATAAANVGVLSTMNSYFQNLSTGQRFASTFIAENLITPNSISITSPFLISKLSTPGFVLISQTLNVYGNVYLSNALNVSGITNIVSSLYAEDVQPLSSVVRVLSSVGVGGNVSVGEFMRIQSTLTLQSSVQINTLQVKLSTLSDTVVISESALVRGLLSSLGNFYGGRQLTIGSNLLMAQEVSTLGALSTFQLDIGGDASLRQNISTLSTASFASTVQGYSSFTIAKTLEFKSTFGFVGALAASSFSTVSFSTLGSFSTFQLELLSTATIYGSVSTTTFQSYSYMSIGGSLYTPAAISSLNRTTVGNEMSVLGTASFSNVHTSSSLGIGGNLSVVNSTFASYFTVQGNTEAGSLQITGGADIQGSLGIGNTGFLAGNLTVLQGSEISSFFVESFLLSNVQILTSSPFVSFRVSSLHASTLQTEFTRISTLQPDILTVSTTYASTTQFTTAIVENARLENAYTESFFAGNTSLLASESLPKVALNVKAQFAQGLSTLTAEVNALNASGYIEGNPTGNVFYLSNVPARFPNLSAMSVYISTLTLSSLYTSSFVASTLQVNKFINVYSTVITPYIVFESQGFEPRFDKNQMLTLNPNLMVVNRSLYFDRQTNRIGLNISSPTVDFDISGYVFASNIYYSSINPITQSSFGTVLFSTIFVSSSYIADSLQYGSNGLQLYNFNIFGGQNYFAINKAASTSVNSFGFFDCVEQSSILINSGLFVYRDQNVSINGAEINSGTFVLPSHTMDIYETVRAKEASFSTTNLFESLQTTSFVSPTLILNSNGLSPLNTLSASINKLFINEFVVLQTSPFSSNRYMGIQTSNPQCSLDVRGDASFSTLRVFENLRSQYVAMSALEL